MSGTENILYSSLVSRYNLRELAEWQNLLRHFALAADGFAFIVLLVPDVDGAEICHQALEQHLAENGKTLWRIPLEKPDDLKLLAGKLLELKLPESAGAVWVSATTHQTLSEEERWKAAWRQGVAQLNQYRNPLRDRIETTLIFAGAPWLQGVIREMAPDLWSVRTLVATIQPQQVAELSLSLSEREPFDGRSSSDPELALREAEKLRGQPGKELALARMLHRAGEGLMGRDQWREAASLFEQSLELKRRFHDSSESIGLTLNALGGANFVLGKVKEAIPFFEQSLSIARQIGARPSESQALGNLGIVYRNLGEPRNAIGFYEQSLKLHREIGDRRGESADLSNLGIAYKDLGELHKAIEFYERALNISREIGDRRGEGADLGNLGVAYKDLGELHKAIEIQNQRLVIAREIGDRRGEGNALGNLGIAYKHLGEPHKAIGFHEQHLAIAREIGDRRGEANSLWGMALSFDELGERRRAIALAEQSLRIYEEIEDPYAEEVRKQLAGWQN
jgi:tetratricopeptide (TPR) repeat protein